MAVPYEAIVFDLGGTLLAIEDDEIAADNQGRVRFLPGVVEALTALAGRPVFVVTNQQGVALGTLREAEARGFIEQLNAAVDGMITDYRICLHRADAGCPCRKPRPGMLQDWPKPTASISPAALWSATARTTGAAPKPRGPAPSSGPMRSSPTRRGRRPEPVNRRLARSN